MEEQKWIFIGVNVGWRPFSSSLFHPHAHIHWEREREMNKHKDDRHANKSIKQIQILFFRSSRNWFRFIFHAMPLFPLRNPYTHTHLDKTLHTIPRLSMIDDCLFMYSYTPCSRSHTDTQTHRHITYNIVLFFSAGWSILYINKRSKERERERKNRKKNSTISYNCMIVQKIDFFLPFWSDIHIVV